MLFASKGRFNSMTNPIDVRNTVSLSVSLLLQFFCIFFRYSSNKIATHRFSAMLHSVTLVFKLQELMTASTETAANDTFKVALHAVTQFLYAVGLKDAAALVLKDSRKATVLST